MSWINDSVNRYRLRDTDYNRSVCMTRQNLDNMMRGFDTIFNNISNFTSELTSVQVYPMIVKPYLNANNNYLKTSRGVFSGVTAYKISYYAYYQTLGQKYIPTYFGNFADYKGYTHIKVFLPFLGYVDIDPNECVGKWLQFRLLTDFYTGKGMYIIGVSESGISHSESPYVHDGEDDAMRVVYTYECDIGIEIPLGQSNIGDIKRNMLLGAVKTAAGVGIASHTNSLPPPSSHTTNVQTYTISARGNTPGARMRQVESGVFNTESHRTYTNPYSQVRPVSEAIDGSIDVLNRMNIGGNGDRVNDAGLLYQMSLNIQVIIYRPKFVSFTNDYNHLYGKPLGTIRRLSSLSGYTEVSAVHFEGAGFNTATSGEMEKISSAFNSGVILP